MNSRVRLWLTLFVCCFFIFFTFSYAEDSSDILGDSSLTTISSTTFQDVSEITGDHNKNDDSSKENKLSNLKLDFKAGDKTNEEDENDGEELQCNSGLSTFVRNINASSFLPDDYYELSENMWKEDLYAPVKDMNFTFGLMDRFLAYGSKLQSNKDAKEAIQYLFSVFSDRLYDAKISPICMADILRVIKGIQNRELWAIKMPDAWANTVPSGLMSGHVSSFGEYDQCVKIKSPAIPQPDGLPDRHVYGRYCTAQARIKVPDLNSYNPDWEDIVKNNSYYINALKAMKENGFVEFNVEVVKMIMEAVPVLRSNIAHYGICMPNTCSSEDMQNIFNAFFYPISKVPTVVDPDLCTDHEEIREVKLDSFQWFAIYVLSILTGLVILSTCYHLYLMYLVDNKRQLLPTLSESNNNNLNENQKLDKNSDSAKILSSNLTPANNEASRTLVQEFILSFSFIDNTQKLIQPDDRLAIVDTLRLLLTVGVYAVQAFNFSMMLTLQILRNQVDTLPGQLISQNRYFMARVPGMYIDGFVFTLGFTLYLSQISRLRKSNGQFSYFTYMFKRWFRLSAAMLGTFVFLYLFTLSGDGPLWFINERWVLTPCKKVSSIISSFLYYSNWNPAINNYHSKGAFPICNPPTWFLSASTQIYAVLPLIFVPLYRWPKVGMTILLTLFVLSPILISSPTWFLGHLNYYDITDVQNAAHYLRKFLNYHVNPIQYSASVTIGIITGWILKNHPKFQFPGGRKTELALWVLSFSTIVACFASNNYLWTVEHKRPSWMTLTWIISVKFLWPLSLAYIIFMCSSGRARTMNKHLSVNSLQPLAKLSYSIYLLRVPVIFYRYTTVRYTYGLYYWQVWQNVAIDYMVTAVLAFFLYILFEAPSIQIIRIFEADKLWSYLEGGSSPNNKNDPKMLNGNGKTLPVVEEKIPDKSTEEPQTPQFYVFNGIESQRL